MELLTDYQIEMWKRRVQKSIKGYFDLMDKWTEQQEHNCLHCKGNCDSCSFFKLQEQYCEIFGIN